MTDADDLPDYSGCFDKSDDKADLAMKGIGMACVITAPLLSGPALPIVLGAGAVIWGAQIVKKGMEIHGEKHRTYED